MYRRLAYAWEGMQLLPPGQLGDKLTVAFDFIFQEGQQRQSCLLVIEEVPTGESSGPLNNAACFYAPGRAKAYGESIQKTAYPRSHAYENRAANTSVASVISPFGFRTSPGCMSERRNNRGGKAIYIELYCVCACFATVNRASRLVNQKTTVSAARSRISLVASLVSSWNMLYNILASDASNAAPGRKG